MIPAHRNSLVAALALLITSVGLIEAAAGDNWDQLVLLAAVAGLLLALLAGQRAGRQPVDLRADLSTWLHEHAAATGEPARQLLDGCVAAYQADVSVPDSQPDQAPTKG